MPSIHGYHAHIYFDADTLERARALAEAAGERFPLRLGRVHQRPIGPHPTWSCQLAFRPQIAGEVIGWLALNRQGLSVLIHPVTGNDLVDHRDRAIWMGAVLPLDLSSLSDLEQGVSYEF